MCVSLVSQEYIINVDPVSQLGLNSDSVLGYSIGEVHRSSGAETPELLPCGYLVGDSDTIAVKLKGRTGIDKQCSFNVDSTLLCVCVCRPP